MVDIPAPPPGFLPLTGAPAGPLPPPPPGFVPIAPGAAPAAPSSGGVPPWFMPGEGMDAGMVDPNQSLTRPQPGALPQPGFATGGPVDPMGAPHMPGLEAPRAEHLAQVLITAVPGLSWVRGLRIATQFGPRIAKALGIGVNLAAQGAVGGVSGGAMAAMQPGATPGSITEGARFGAMTGAAVPPALMGAGKVVSTVGRVLGLGRNVSPEIAARLGQEADAVLARARQAGLVVDSNAMLTAFQGMETAMRGGAVAVRKSTAEKAFNLLEELRGEVAQAGNLQFDDLFNIRMSLRTLYKTQDEAQQAAAAAMIREFDSAIDALPQSAILGGNSDTAFADWQSYRQLYQRVSKVDDLESILFVAKGAPNPENSIVQQLRRIRNSPTFEKFWTPQERQIINGLVEEGGGGLRRAAQALSDLSPMRFAGKVAGGMGLATGNLPLAGAALLAGAVAQRATRMTREQVVLDLINHVGGVSAPPTAGARQMAEELVNLPTVGGAVNALRSAAGRFFATEQGQSPGFFGVR